MLEHRQLSLRGYHGSGMMKAAIVAEGNELKEQLIKLLENVNLSYVHIHNARPGCFNCVVEREDVYLKTQDKKARAPLHVRGALSHKVVIKKSIKVLLVTELKGH